MFGVTVKTHCNKENSFPCMHFEVHSSNFQDAQ